MAGYMHCCGSSSPATLTQAGRFYRSPGSGARLVPRRRVMNTRRNSLELLALGPASARGQNSKSALSSVKTGKRNPSEAAGSAKRQPDGRGSMIDGE